MQQLFIIFLVVARQLGHLGLYLIYLNLRMFTLIHMCDYIQDMMSHITCF